MLRGTNSVGERKIQILKGFQNDLEKAHVKAHVRTLKNGKQIQVKEYENKKVAKEKDIASEKSKKTKKEKIVVKDIKPKSFDDFLVKIDKMSEAELKKTVFNGTQYLETPGDFEEQYDYGDIQEYYSDMMGNDFKKLKDLYDNKYVKKNMKEVKEAKEEYPVFNDIPFISFKEYKKGFPNVSIAKRFYEQGLKQYAKPGVYSLVFKNIKPKDAKEMKDYGLKKEYAKVRVEPNDELKVMQFKTRSNVYLLPLSSYKVIKKHNKIVVDFQEWNNNFS